MLLRLTWAKCFTVSLDLEKEVNAPLKTIIAGTDHCCGENWAVEGKIWGAVCVNNTSFTNIRHLLTHRILVTLYTTSIRTFRTSTQKYNTYVRS